MSRTPQGRGVGVVSDEPVMFSTCNDANDIGCGPLSQIVVSAVQCPHLSPLDGLDGGEVDGGGQGWGHASHDVVHQRG